MTDHWCIRPAVKLRIAVGPTVKRTRCPRCNRLMTVIRTDKGAWVGPHKVRKTKRKKD